MKTAIIHIPDSKFDEFVRFARLHNIVENLCPGADPRDMIFMTVLVSANEGIEATVKETKDAKTD